MRATLSAISRTLNTDIIRDVAALAALSSIVAAAFDWSERRSLIVFAREWANPAWIAAAVYVLLVAIAALRSGSIALTMASVGVALSAALYGAGILG
ncbi:hypothetical protein J2W92_002292 [Rhizobium leguminosarum]